MKRFFLSVACLISVLLISLYVRSADVDLDLGLGDSSSDVQKTDAAASSPDAPDGRSIERGRVTGIIDADTIEIDGKRMSLLGVAAPERTRKGKPKECYSDEAASFLTSLVKDQDVQFTFDPIQRARDYRGIKRIYLFKGEEEINLRLIEKGAAFADRSKRYYARSAYIKSEAEAKLRLEGLWGVCPVSCERRDSCKTRNW